MIHGTPPIDGYLKRSLHELDELHATLAHEVKRPRRWNGQLRRNALMDAVVASTSIEGYHVTAAEARALVDGTMPTAVDSDSKWAVSCYARGMEHTQVMAADPMFEWSHRVVLDLHFDTCQFQRGRSPGLYRTGPVHVSGPGGGVEYTAPDASDVPTLMSEMLQSLTRADEEHVVVRAAMAHLRFVAIHPFRDGNGRLARILQSLTLGRSAILAPEFASIEPFLAANTTQYYDALRTTQDAGTYAPSMSTALWLEFCIEAHLVLGRDFEARMHALGRYWRSVERVVESRGWPERLTIAIDLAMHALLTRAAYVSEAEVPAPTAAGDLRRLVDAGFLVQHGGGRSTSYVASDALRSAIEQDG